MSNSISNDGWIKAAASAANGNCLELRGAPGVVAIRDSKDPEGLVLVFGKSGFAEFLTGAKTGEFDHLAGGGA